MRRVLPVLAVCAAAMVAWAPPAAAGTYTVSACTVDGRLFDNRSWAVLPAGNVFVDNACASRNTLIGLRIDPGKVVSANTAGGLTFTSPAGTAITDFVLDRQLDYDSPAVDGRQKPFALYQLGSIAFAGAGYYNNTVRRRLDAQRSWYGYPSSEAHVARGRVTRASFRALAGYKNDARTLLIRAGCFGATPCQIGPGGRLLHVAYGARITVDDFTVPSSMTVEAAGLLSGGWRDGSDAVTLSAADNAGVRRVEIIDLTNPASPRVVGSEDYAAGSRSDRGATCSYRFAKPCLDLSSETIRAGSLEVGRRSLLVRVVDAGGNYLDRGPYTVDVATPSNRGDANGTNAKEPARVLLRFSATAKKRRTVRFGKKVGIRGRLLNADGQPIGGATLRLLTRDLRQGAQAVDRRAVTTRSDGSFRLTVRALASRQLQVAWHARANDSRFAANGYLTLRARAAGSLRARKSIVVGRRLTLRGRLKGVRRGGVPVVLQGKVRGARRWQTFADATTSGRGTFRAGYRFRTAGARGRTYVFRARIRRAPGFPYETGYSRTVRVRVR